MPKKKNIPLDDLTDELWVPVKGYESLYHVSNMGRVKSLAKQIPAPNSGVIDQPDIIMSPSRTWNGYLYVNLCKGRKKRTRTIHRLVAIHFVHNPDPDKLTIVDHIYGDKDDNRASVLAWVSSAINNKRAYDLGLRKAAWTGVRGDASPSAKPVAQLSKDGVLIKSFSSRVSASQSTGIPAGQINNAVAGRQKTAGGFRWTTI